MSFDIGIKKEMLTFYSSTGALTGLQNNVDIRFIRADNSAVITASNFQELGAGKYEFWNFDVPNITFSSGGADYQGALNILCQVWNGSSWVTQANAMRVYKNSSQNDGNDDYPPSRAFIENRLDRQGDTMFGYITDSPTGAFTALNPASYQHVNRLWVETNFVASSSLTSILLSSYAVLTGNNIFSGTNTFNNSTLNLVATKLNGQGATADFRKITVTGLTANNGVVSIYNNLGMTQTGDHFTYGFKNTDGDDVSVFSMGCDGGEIPYIDFKNRQVLNFNPAVTISMSAYMPLTGGVFSGSVTANMPRLVLASNTKIYGTSATADLKIISATALSLHSDAGLYGNGTDILDIKFRDTGGDPNNIFSVGFNGGEQGYIDCKGNQLINAVPKNIPYLSSTGGNVSGDLSGTNIFASSKLDANNIFLNGNNINTSGVLTNVAYLNQANEFTEQQKFMVAALTADTAGGASTSCTANVQTGRITVVNQATSDGSDFSLTVNNDLILLGKSIVNVTLQTDLDYSIMKLYPRLYAVNNGSFEYRIFASGGVFSNDFVVHFTIFNAS